ncbi:hypothetical protein GCM10023231_12580 [Olivibacter ginsenosidimutans]|uniref:Crp/Fnr family transcriptional regulator n=1 Tax=Olivibacter ginsenosidimutans TaxID=1176537 RepID=A0ABP9AUI7_9SPHI
MHDEKAQYIRAALTALRQAFNLPEALEVELTARARLVMFSQLSYIEYPGLAEDGYLWYMVRGIARSVVFDQQFQLQYSLFLWTKGDVIFQPDSFFFEKPREEAVQVLEDSILLQLPIPQLRRLLATFPQIDQLLAHLWGQHELRLIRYSSWLHLGTRERMKAFLTYYPNITERVPHYLLAEFLNMNRNTFSRLLRSIKKK